MVVFDVIQGISLGVHRLQFPSNVSLEVAEIMGNENATMDVQSYEYPQ